MHLALHLWIPCILCGVVTPLILNGSNRRSVPEVKPDNAMCAKLKSDPSGERCQCWMILPDKDIDAIDLTCTHTSVHIPTVQPSEYAPHVQTLTLRASGVVYFSVELNIYHNMKKLVMTGGNLTTLGASSLSGTPLLEEINLSNNLLHRSFTSAVWQSTPHLVELRLAGNPLERLHVNMFGSIPSLQRLILSDCHLSGIDPEVFNGLTRLTMLVLSGNQLTSVTFMDTLPTLSWLDLSHNMFVTLETGFVRDVNLDKLSMDRSPLLTTIQTGAISDCPELQEISFNSSPRLTLVEQHAIVNVSQRADVQLQYCNISSLKEDAVPFIDQDHVYISLHGNPIHCTCDAKWMANSDNLPGLSDTKVTHGVKCASPAEYKGHLVVDTVANMTCTVDSDPVISGPVIALIILVTMLVIASGIFIFLILWRRHQRYARRNYFRCSEVGASQDRLQDG